MNLRALNHGHPLLPARQLRRRPVTVRLHGIDIVLFRSSSVENSGAFRAVTLDLLMADEITGADDWRGKVQRFPL